MNGIAGYQVANRSPKSISKGSEFYCPRFRQTIDTDAGEEKASPGLKARRCFSCFVF